MSTTLALFCIFNLPNPPPGDIETKRLPLLPAFCLPLVQDRQMETVKGSENPASLCFEAATDSSAVSIGSCPILPGSCGCISVLSCVGTKVKHRAERTKDV